MEACIDLGSRYCFSFAAMEEEKELLFLQRRVMSGTYNWLLVITNYKENWKHIWLIFASEKKRNHLQKNLFSNKTFPIATHYKEITIIWWQLLYLCSQFQQDFQSTNHTIETRKHVLQNLRWRGSFWWKIAPSNNASNILPDQTLGPSSLPQWLRCVRQCVKTLFVRHLQPTHPFLFKRCCRLFTQYGGGTNRSHFGFGKLAQSH